MRSIILAVSNPDFCSRVSQILIRAGLSVRVVSYSGGSLLRQAMQHEDGGVVIFHPDLPDMSVTEVHSMMPETFDFIILGKSRRETDIERLDGVTVLDLPVSGSALAEAASNLIEYRTTAVGSRGYTSKLSSVKPASVKRSSSEENILLEAKKRMMNAYHMTEDQAHRYLQRESMRTGIRIIEIARRINETEQGA